VCVCVCVHFSEWGNVKIYNRDEWAGAQVIL
jgi:hypothetical protein